MVYASKNSRLAERIINSNLTQKGAGFCLGERENKEKGENRVAMGGG